MRTNIANTQNRPPVLKNNKGNVEAMGFELNDSMMAMMGGFTILRLLGMAGGMLGIEVSKEELLALNAKLNKIKAPKKKEK